MTDQQKQIQSAPLANQKEFLSLAKEKDCFLTNASESERTCYIYRKPFILFILRETKRTSKVKMKRANRWDVCTAWMKSFQLENCIQIYLSRSLIMIVFRSFLKNFTTVVYLFPFFNSEVDFEKKLVQHRFLISVKMMSWLSNLAIPFTALIPLFSTKPDEPELMLKVFIQSINLTGH